MASGRWGEAAMAAASAMLVAAIMVYLHDEGTMYMVRTESSQLHAQANSRLVSIKENLRKIDNRVKAWLRSEGLKVSEDADLKELTMLAEGLQQNKTSLPGYPLSLDGKRVIRGLSVEPSHAHDRVLTDEYLLMVERMGKEGASTSSGKHSSSSSSGGKDLEIPGRNFVGDADVKDRSGKHPILGLSNEEFSSKQVSDLIQDYEPPTAGTADGKEFSCEDDFGISLVDRWRKKKEEYCSPKGSTEIGGKHATGSSIECYFLHQTSHGGKGDNLCVLNNFAINLGVFMNTELTSEAMSKYKSTKHSDEAYIHYPKGTVGGRCTINAEKYHADKFPGWNGDWLVKGLETTEEEDKDFLNCDFWEETTTLFVQRDTFANMYHDSEDFFNAFLAMSILQLSLDQVQLVLSDLYPWGPFASIWKKVYGFTNRPFTAWELREKYEGKRVCFKKAIIGIYGPASPLTIMQRETRCFSSPLVRSFSDFIIRGHKLQRFAPPVQKENSKIIVVSWIARRSSVMWPERAFCDERYFVCKDWEHLSTRTLGRVVKNENEVLAALRDLQKSKFPDGREMYFIDADYNTLTLEQQLQCDIQTDVMVGPHGAGLTHQIFLPDRAYLIELFVDGSSANKHFHNMARWRGRVGDMYKGVTIENPVPVDKVVNLVKGAVEMVSLN